MTATPALRPDQQHVAAMIAPGSRVLDVGCGEGTLLHWLTLKRGVKGHGIELSQEGVNACVQKGLAVIQGDADTDLADYPDGAFDYTILSHSIQAMYEPKTVLEQMARISRHIVVSFPNFGYLPIRLRLLLDGRMPSGKAIPYAWYNTPNIHLCTWADMQALCVELGLRIHQTCALRQDGSSTVSWWPNGRAEQGVMLITK